MNVDRVIALTAIFATVIVTTIAAGATIIGTLYTNELRKTGEDLYAFHGYSIATALLVFLIFQMCCLIFFETLRRRGRNKSHALSLQIQALESELTRYREITLIDVVTGIPNQLKLESDSATLSNKITQKEQYQIIIIDLDRFRTINNQFGHQKGDFVIRYIAQGIYNSVRRDEESYKRPIDRKNAEWLFGRSVYRKYSGRDEFIFLVRGTESDAIGFVSRLYKKFENEFSIEIEKMLDTPWKIRFHAGICDVEPNDTFTTMIERVEKCLVCACQEGSKSRVYWKSRKTSVNFTDPKIAQTYAEAEKLFAV